MPTNKKAKISTATIIRTICLVLALGNQLLSAFGKSPLPIDNEQVEQLVSAVVTIITALAGWWYNNSFTHAAIEGDKTYERVKKNVR